MSCDGVVPAKGVQYRCIAVGVNMAREILYARGRAGEAWDTVPCMSPNIEEQRRVLSGSLYYTHSSVYKYTDYSRWPVYLTFEVIVPVTDAIGSPTTVPKINLSLACKGQSDESPPSKRIV